MTISELRTFPQSFQIETVDELQSGDGGIYTSSHKYHESLLRSFQIVSKVKQLLEIDTPPSVVLEIINEVERGGTDLLVIDAHGNIAK